MKVINFLGSRIGSGGIESFVANMSEHMRENGVDYIVCVNYRTSNIYEQRLRNNGAEVVYLRDMPANYFQQLLDYMKYISNNKGAVLYLHASTPGMYLHAFIARLFGIKRIVYHVHSTLSNRVNRLKKIKDKCLEFFFRDIPQVNVACSKEAGDSFYRNKNYTVVHNGINVERFKFSEEERKKTRDMLGVENEFLFIQIGRFSPQKNQFFTLDILKQCIEKGMPVKLLFIGEGQYEKGMRGYIKEKGLDNSVLILPPDKNIERYYMAADLLMFPSQYEGLGIVALEAQTAGLPVLASSCIVDEVCFTEFIERVNLNDKEKWIQKIQNYIDNMCDREKQSLIGYSGCVKNGFSIDNGRKELLEIYSVLK